MTSLLSGLHLVPLGEDHAQKLCEWKYEPPYDRYNWPSWEDMQEKQEEFADPAIRAAQYRAVLDGSARLVGFVQFFPIAGVTRLGLGLRPDLCGRGLGQGLARLAAEEALRLNPDHEIDLEVRLDNERALRTYRKAGFRITDEYERPTPTGPASFYCMVYEKTTSH
ncbi:GNAT family N-acetyltransferase [Gorillibacterium sp. CAU 1737]|uniref:GNAT family N-acetyltransferase n=1 Tax=Gorillibacterium sp. CAU 1737 TaxID=3140362 RepID=UPI00326129AD